jgi:hypothetical protein
LICDDPLRKGKIFLAQSVAVQLAFSASDSDITQIRNNVWWFLEQLTTSPGAGHSTSVLSRSGYREGNCVATIQNYGICCHWRLSLSNERRQWSERVVAIPDRSPVLVRMAEANRGNCTVSKTPTRESARWSENQTAKVLRSMRSPDAGDEKHQSPVTQVFDLPLHYIPVWFPPAF